MTEASANAKPGVIDILHWANRVADTRSAGEGRVLLALADHCNASGKTFVSIETVARECRAGRRTVEGHIRALSSRGVIARTRRPNRPTLFKLPSAAEAVALVAAAGKDGGPHEL